jgi:prepilin-type N-terminal cleavage/methylation domain-containing protein
MQKKQKTAFSLVELSIVILIVSILVTGSLGISKTALGNSKSKITKERMDTIYKALTSFVATNRRLPCPSVLTLAKGTAGYGVEAATPGTCTSVTTISGNTVYGMIPITALGLDPDMGEDGFGTKFSYVVDKRFTKQSASTASSDGFEITKSVVAENGAAITPTLIRVQGPSGTDIVPDLNALFVLISHGANKANGWNATGTTQNPAGSIANETSNSSLDSVSTYIAYSTDANFDDILLFKTKPHLVRDAGLEFMMCNGAEAQTANNANAWTTNGMYSCNICSTAANNSKFCGKYGVWSPINTVIQCTANSSVCATAQSGKILNQVIVPITGADLFILTQSGTTTSFETIATVNYDPVSSSSKLIIEFHAAYKVIGWGTDSLESRLAIGETQIGYQRQYFISEGGGGSRSSTLFPLVGFYDNTSTAQKTFLAQVRRFSGDDSILIYRSLAGSVNMKITEVAN